MSTGEQAQGHGATGPELTIVRDGNRVAIAGDVRTTADRDLLKERVAEVVADGHTTAILDVSHATYFDVATLIALVTIAKKCAESGATLVLEHVNEPLRTQLHATHIDEVLTIVAKRAKAAP
jgi:anti-anti-sigma factor